LPGNRHQWDLPQPLEAEERIWRGAGSYVPPAGSVFIAAGGRTGFLQSEGIQIGIDAGSESAVLTAARALVPMAAP
jgi:hypothetical protein